MYLCFSEIKGEDKSRLKIKNKKQNKNFNKKHIIIPYTQAKLVKEKQLVHSIIRSEDTKRQIDIFQSSKRQHLHTLIQMAKNCFTDRKILNKYNERDKKYLKSKKNEVITAFDKLKTSNLKKDEIITILSRVSNIDNGKILRKLLKSYVIHN